MVNEMEAIRRFDVPHPRRRALDWVDLVIGLAAVVISVAVAATVDIAAIDPRLQESSMPALVLTAVGASGITLWRRQPMLGVLVIAVVSTGVSAAGYFVGALPLVLMAGLCALSANGTRRQTILGLGITATGYTGAWMSHVPALSSVDVLTSLAWCVAAVALGEAVRQRRARNEGRIEAAELRGELAAERAVVEERLRIARELHDVVAHSMSLIAVQAGVGAHVLRTNPAAAERALEVIAQTSRDALDQTRSVVGLLRTGEDAQPSMPGLASLQALLDGVRGSGGSVDLQVVGEARELPPVVDLAAYRVVQESLTNAVKHAKGCAVTVRLGYAAEELTVDVSNACGPSAPRPTAQPGPAGFGLVGLRERARALGGRLDAGPTAHGGFRVAARLPTAQPTTVLA
jgi:signal transduction histidine kinase